MSSKPYHVVGIGNAIVDVLAFTPDEFITAQGMRKGTMALIDEAQAHKLYEAMPQATEVSGGSAANTLAALAALGGRAGFIGKVFKDELGHIFRHDLQSVGVDFATPPRETGQSTARCLILVTPDGQRTMNTFLGAAGEIEEADIDAALIAKAQYLYIEGYLWDLPGTKAAIRHAIKLAKESGTKIALTLSDMFCVERARGEFRAMLKEIDVLFCNEAEAMSLFETQDLQGVLNSLAKECKLAVVTRGAHGSVILADGKQITVGAAPVAKIVDTTGAGDLFAAGFLHGLSHGKPLKECGQLGSSCAAQILVQLGARSQQPLKKLIA